MTNFLSTDLFGQIQLAYGYFFKADREIDMSLELIDSYTDKFDYLGEVDSYALRLIDTCEILENIRHQLVIPASEEYLKSIKLERIDFFHYTVQNYYIRISTIYDLLIILTSKLIRLGLREQDINEKHILENRVYRNHEFIEPIKSFKKLIKDIKPKRNTIVHRGYFEDKKFQELLISEKFSRHRINRTISNPDDFAEEITRFGGETEVLNQRTNEIVSTYLDMTSNYFKKTFDMIQKNGL